MEETIQMQDTDLNYDSSCSTPYITAPSSPHFKTNKPSFDELDGETQNDEDFAFDFSGQLGNKSPVFAEELFHKGKIKPLRLKASPQLRKIIKGGFEFDESKSNFDDDPVVFISAISSPRSPISMAEKIGKSSPGSDFQLQSSNNGGSEEQKSDIDDDPVHFISAISSPKSPICQNTTKIKQPFSPKRVKSSDFDPFEDTLKTIMSVPLRVSDILNEPEDQDKVLVVKKDSFFSLLSISKAYKKMKSSNYRSSENIPGVNSTSSSVSRRRVLAANELRYAVTNRAVTAEEKKRKTFLPYKKGLLGCLGYNPAMHDVSRTTGSLARV